MNALLKVLRDPYLHVLVLGLVLVRAAMAVGGDEPVGASRKIATCARCLERHADYAGGCRVAVVLTQMFEDE